MSTQQPRFRGVHTAIITPFRDGAVDYDALAALVEVQVAGGVQGIVPCGTTGEASTLSDAERVEVTRVVVRAAAGRVQVTAGVGTNDTARTIDMARQAQGLGVDAGLVITPYYNKPTQEGLYHHFRAIAEAVPELPLVLYNVPARTALCMSVETIDRLADLPSVVALKEATGDMAFDARIAARCGDRLTLLSGDDATAFPLWSLGGRGVISVTSNLLPARMVALWEAFERGALEEARHLHLRLMPLFDGLFMETNPVPVKVLVARSTGLCAEDCRLPLVPLQPRTEAALRSICETLEVPLS